MLRWRKFVSLISVISTSALFCVTCLMNRSISSPDQPAWITFLPRESPLLRQPVIFRFDGDSYGPVWLNTPLCEFSRHLLSGAFDALRLCHLRHFALISQPERFPTGLSRQADPEIPTISQMSDFD